MNILVLRKFNNYFNRIVVKYDTLAEYQNRADSYLRYTNINFNPNDGVNTEVILGGDSQKELGAPIDFDNNGGPDYVVCYENPTPFSTRIRSRWFVIECQRTRLGQYRLVLKRDSIADHIEEVEEATCFIEKGIIEDSEDPAIYNKEDITTNQIKSAEYLLKDETQCGWVVGYVAKDRTDPSDGHIEATTFIDQTIAGPEANDSACSEIYET